MLVLTRKISEKMIIGDNIEVTVVRISANQVRIGVTAPREISVRRGELDEQPAEKTSNKSTVFDREGQAKAVAKHMPVLPVRHFN